MHMGPSESFLGTYSVAVGSLTAEGRREMRLL